MAMRIMLLLIFQLIIKFLPAQLCLYKTDKDISKYLNANKEWEYQIINLFNPIENKDTFCAEIWMYELQYPDGKTKLKGTLKNGIPIGEIIYFHENGEIRLVENWGNNKKINAVYFKDNGDTIYIKHLDTISKITSMKYFFEDNYEIIQKDSNNNNKYEKYNYKNVMIEKGEIKQGNTIGLRLLYNDKGNLIDRVYFNNEDSIKVAKKNVSVENAIMPKFEGGWEGITNFLHKNIVYPLYSKNNNLTKKVPIGFTINSTGKVDELNFDKINIFDEFTTEAIRVISIMPNWTPGFQNNEYVNVSYFLPIQFNLD